MTGEYEEIICSFPLFQGFTRHGAAGLIERGEICQCTPGSSLFKEGAPADFVVLVLSGNLQVYVERGGRDMVLTQSGPGTIVGELAVLCGIARSASVRAGTEPAVILKWSADSFRRILLGNVFLSQRIFGEALRGLIEKEQSLIDSLLRSPS